MTMKKMMMKPALLILLAGMANSVMAQNADHSVERDNTKNQVMLKLNKGGDKYYNTADLQYIDIKDKDVIVRHNDGDDTYTNKVLDIAFFKADKPAALTKADLVGTWVVEAQEESGEEAFSYTFTADKLTAVEQGAELFTVPYTFEDGILSYTVPATEWSEACTETRSVSLLYDKSVLVMKYKPEEWETDEGLEEAEVYINKEKQPDISGANLDGKWFCYHRGSKSEVRSGLWIEGDKAEFIIGAWATRMVGTYTYEKGILTLHPTDYYSGRSEYDWGYGRIDPATLECSQWDKIENPGFPETFVFILNGEEAYSWYANLPCLYYKQ